MQIQFRNHGLTAVTFAVLLATSSVMTPAMAQSARDKVLASIAEAAKAAGATEVTWGKVSGDDAKFTVEESKTVIEADGKTTTLTAESVTYTGAKPTADGGYSVDEIAIVGLEAEGDDSTMSIGTAKITGYVGQSAEKIRAKTSTGEKFDKIELATIEISDENDKTVPIASVSLATSDYVGGVPRRTSFDLKGLSVPVDAADESMKDVAALGYTKLQIDASFTGSWDDKTGRVVVEPLSVSGADIGGLKLAFTLGGLTPAVIDAMKKAEGDNAKQMELMQGITIEKLSLRYDDASFAKRIIASEAKKQGVPPEAFTQQIEAILPMMLSAVGNKEFEKKVATAGGAFLKAPKSLTVSAMPGKPLSVMEIMGAAMTAPQTLPTVLAADVKAND